MNSPGNKKGRAVRDGSLTAAQRAKTIIVKSFGGACVRDASRKVTSSLDEPSRNCRLYAKNMKYDHNWPCLCEPRGKLRDVIVHLCVLQALPPPDSLSSAYLFNLGVYAIEFPSVSPNPPQLLLRLMQGSNIEITYTCVGEEPSDQDLEKWAAGIIRHDGEGDCPELWLLGRFIDDYSTDARQLPEQELMRIVNRMRHFHTLFKVSTLWQYPYPEMLAPQYWFGIQVAEKQFWHLVKNRLEACINEVLKALHQQWSGKVNNTVVYHISYLYTIFIMRDLALYYNRSMTEASHILARESRGIAYQQVSEVLTSLERPYRLLIAYYTSTFQKIRAGYFEGVAEYPDLLIRTKACLQEWKEVREGLKNKLDEIYSPDPAFWDFYMRRVVIENEELLERQSAKQ